MRFFFYILNFKGPTSGNGVWIPSNNGSPLNEQQIIYTNEEKTL